MKAVKAFLKVEQIRYFNLQCGIIIITRSENISGIFSLLSYSGLSYKPLITFSMKRISLVILLVVSLTVTLSAQVDSIDSNFAVKDTQDVKVTLFDTDDLLEISLKFDINKYKRYKSDTLYLPAVLTYHLSETDSVVKNIRVRARGNIRRTAICDFPPLMMNFKVTDSVDSEFAGLNKLKIVPYCKAGFENYILKEYLVYKLFNVVTDYSLRVRLFRITYINTANEKKPLTQYGFALEPVEVLERRTETVEAERKLTQRDIRQDMLDRVAVFNYMIGNTDWSVPIQHNVILLQEKENPRSKDNLIVAYDFDYSGFVNTNYAVPFTDLPIENVRQRLYMAVCRSEERFTGILNEFAEKKDEFYSVVSSFPYLPEKTKVGLIKYLDEFYYGMDKRNTLVKKLRDDCLWFESQSNLRVK